MPEVKQIKIECPTCKAGLTAYKNISPTQKCPHCDTTLDVPHDKMNQ